MTPSKDFTPSQKKAVAAFNKEYTKTTNTLLKNSKDTALVKGPNGKTVKVNAGVLAKALEKQVFNVDEKPGDMALNETMDTEPGITNIAPIGLQPPTGLVGVSGTPSELWGTSITHEAIHAAYPWTQNMWTGLPYQDWWYGHQQPFNVAAAELLQ